jgi:hypothetical protein
MSDEPIWMTWVEPEVADLTDGELQEYIDTWRGNGERYRAQRQQISTSHPDAYRLAYSAWWCSKRESIGLREFQRRSRRRRET